MFGFIIVFLVVAALGMTPLTTKITQYSNSNRLGVASFPCNFPTQISEYYDIRQHLRYIELKRVHSSIAVRTEQASPIRRYTSRRL